MSRFFVSYKPYTGKPDWDDPYFDRSDAEEQQAPDAAEQAMMRRLAGAFKAAVPLIVGGEAAISPNDVDTDSLTAIDLTYSSAAGKLEICILREEVTYDISWQHGGELFGVINRLLLLARQTAGYYAYSPDAGDGPFDPLAPEENMLPLYEIMANGPGNYQPDAAPEMPTDTTAPPPAPSAWWQFWKK